MKIPRHCKLPGQLFRSRCQDSGVLECRASLLPLSVPNRNNNMTRCILNEYQNYAKGAEAVSNVRKNIAYKLYFDGKAIDSDSGISKITIKEQLIYSVTGEKISTGQIYSNVVYQVWGTSKPKSTELKRIPGYTFYSPDDGVVRITMVITDACGNEASTSFDVVKDTLVTPVNLKAAASFESSSANAGYDHKFKFDPVKYYYKNKHLLYISANNKSRQCPPPILALHLNTTDCPE